jgi:hypothetical protein
MGTQEKSANFSGIDIASSIYFALAAYFYIDGMYNFTIVKHLEGHDNTDYDLRVYFTLSTQDKGTVLNGSM